MARTIQHLISYPNLIELLRCRQTRRYFTGEGWTYHPSHAQHFQDELAALQACLAHDLRDMEIVLRDADTDIELASRLVR